MSYPGGFGQPGYPGSYPGSTYPGQTFPGQGYPGQSFPGQGFPGQGFPGQSFPGQGYGARRFNYNFNQNHINQYSVQLFQRYDRNRSGTLTRDEFYALMAELGRTVGIGQFAMTDINDLFNIVDYDRSGQITYGEYRNLLEVLANIRPMPVMGQTAAWRSTSYY